MRGGGAPAASFRRFIQHRDVWASFTRLPVWARGPRWVDSSSGGPDLPEVAAVMWGPRGFIGMSASLYLRVQPRGSALQEP